MSAFLAWGGGGGGLLVSTAASIFVPMQEPLAVLELLHALGTVLPVRRSTAIHGKKTKV